MSDLAPFVAATLRDKVVMELKQENDRLRATLQEQNERLEPWTIEVRNKQSDGIAAVYATGKLSMEGALCRGVGHQERLSDGFLMVDIDLVPTAAYAEGEKFVCSLDSLLDCEVVVRTKHGQFVVGSAENRVDNIRLTEDGTIEVCCFVHRVAADDFFREEVNEMYFTFPITSAQWDALNELAGTPRVEFDTFLNDPDMCGWSVSGIPTLNIQDLIGAVGGSPAVRFQSVYIDVPRAVTMLEYSPIAGNAIID